MKFIHTADIHLGSSMESRLPHDKAAKRAAELRHTFESMTEYAKEHDIHLILLAGDVFDSDRPALADKQRFYDVVKNCPDIDFLYLRGNHDSETSYTETDIPNLKTFSDKISFYKYGNARFYGLELTSDNSTDFYDTLDFSPTYKNIFMLHGQTGSSKGEGLICLPALRDKNIDYLALGHIHTYRCEKLDGRGLYAYSGCLEGRGFDETGEKGFVTVDTDDIDPIFEPFARRTIHEIKVDITGAKSVFHALQTAKSRIDIPKEDMLRIIFEGETDCDTDTLSDDAYSEFSGYFCTSIKNRSLRRIDADEYKDEVSLRGEFVRCVLASADYDDADKSRIITLGLNALDGRELRI